MKKRFLIGSLLGILMLLAACQPASVEEAQPAADLSTPADAAEVAEALATPTAVPTEPPPPTLTPEVAEIETVEEVAAVEPEVEEAAIEAVSGEIQYGRTPEGALFKGNPDAPLTITDYSDFL